MHRLLKVTAVGLVVGILGVILSLTPFGKELEENAGLHLLFKMRGVRRAPPDVIIITLDKASADHFNLPNAPRKWPRSLHADLVSMLIDKEPAVIAFDLIFSDPGLPEHDNALAEAIRRAGNVVLVEWLKTDEVPVFDQKGDPTGSLKIEKIIPPIASLANSALASAPFALPKVPVKVNSYWTFKTGAGDTPSLPVVVFQAYAMSVYNEFFKLLQGFNPELAVQLPASGEEVFTKKSIKEVIRFLKDHFEQNPLMSQNLLENLRESQMMSEYAAKNKILVSLIRMYQGHRERYLNFYGPPGTIQTIPYYQILEEQIDSSGVAVRHDLNGKAVFIGLSEQLRPEEKDGFYTAFSQPNGLDISGVEIAASAFANLLEDMPVEPLGYGAHIILVVFWGALITIVCLLSPAVVAAGWAVGFSMIYLTFAHIQFKQAGIWYPLIIPLFFQTPIVFFASVLWKYFLANRERRNIRTAFGYYLPDNVVNQLAKNMSGIGSSRRIVYGTCLMTDAHEYTSLSETMDPEELSSFMNQYYEVIFEPVKENSGIVSDVIGDSMLALWATARPDATSRSLACCAALEIVRAVEQFNQSSEDRQLPIRIGMHSGYISLGDVGAMDHYEYRAVGDIVNTASRMEGLNKYLGTQILVSDEVLDQLDGFFKRPLGKFVLAGKSMPVVINELICKTETSSEKQKKLCSIFARGVDAYQRQSWGEAIEFFNGALAMDNKDGPSRFYLALAEKYRSDPPATDWDGTVYVDEK
ncbi:MAG: adenylate/guanylate cyclase domain-containing protein [Desulfobacterales bacterium]|nr:MAG: adenylate/guanylate cyclase domain-containing protein [Desulfobacterales bacterium]